VTWFPETHHLGLDILSDSPEKFHLELAALDFPLVVFTVLWPEFLEIKSALDEYLDAATERIIREEVFRVSEEAEERVS